MPETKQITEPVEPNAQSDGQRFHELDRKAVALTMAGVLIAIFMGSLDQTIVATALPTIAKSLHAFGSYSAVVTAYLIASTVALPIGGKLSDVQGRKRFLIGGMVWFVVASALCGLSRTMTQLICFRALKGLGTGVMQAAAFTTIADLYPPIRRGRSIGMVAMISIVANIVGPLLGGYLTDGPGWRYIFLINVPVGLVGCIVVARFFPPIRRPAVENFKIDYWGSLSMVGGVVPVLWALQKVGDGDRWLSSGVAVPIGLGVFFVAVFIAVERHAEHPIVPMNVFRNSIISISLLNSGLSMAALFGVTIFVPLFLQAVLHASAKESGQILLPLSITIALTATATGHLVGYTGRYRSLALAGAAIAIVGAYLLAHMSPDTSRITVLRNTVITGFGLAIIMPIYNLTVQNAAHLAVLGVATSMVYFVRYISSSIGMAVYGTILTTQTKSAGLASALNSVYWVLTGLVMTVFVATFFLRDIPLRRSNVQKEIAACEDGSRPELSWEP
ncbi:MAG TPA: MDR family MFS transporter [Tepidisphaeraceae bacterium]|nr:MDR family MFS transporter [Tepidisphaeraceae bacterium]